MRTKVATAVLIVTAAVLVWQHLNGGVSAHHLLARPDLPAMSNWWGLLILPALSWVLAGRMARRVEAGEQPMALIGGVLGGAAFGGAVALFFTIGRPELCEYLMLSLPIVALVVPVYRAEYVLGFVLAMCTAFGPVLPLLAALILATVAFLVHRGVRLVIASLRRLAR